MKRTLGEGSTNVPFGSKPAVEHLSHPDQREGICRDRGRVPLALYTMQLLDE